MPFEHPKALAFCAYLKRHYKIPNENCLDVGDEIDALWASRYPKSPDNPMTAKGEIAMAREKIREWASVFPKMKICISNHGLRWVRKATAAEIPSELLRSYQEIFHMPEGWVWKEEWRFTHLKHPFRMIHGMGYSGANGHRNAAIDAGISTVIGHLHSHAGICHLAMGTSTGSAPAQKIWAMNVGSLIDREAIAFEYGKESRFKPCLGVGVVFDSGRIPMWIPLE